MTDPDLSPEQDAVRRLLAAAKHQGNIPVDVGERLDATLAKLVSERRTTEPVSPAPVIDLAARRRRQRRASAILAAAALVVGGVSLSQWVNDPIQGAADRDSTALISQGSEPREGESVSGRDASEEAATKGDAARAPAPMAASQTSQSAQAISSTHLVRDLSRVRDTPGTYAKSRRLARSNCRIATGSATTRVVVRLDGKLAVAVFRVPTGPRQRVDVYACDDSVKVVAHLPAP